MPFLGRTAALLAAVAAIAPAQSGRAAPSRLAGFRVPTGNIVCIYDGRALRCDIRSGLVPKASRPRGCPADIDFGQGLDLGPRRAGVVCAGDTVLGEREPVLEYGRAWKQGPIKCRSRVTGLTCHNRRSHGFFLSRRSWRLS